MPHNDLQNGTLELLKQQLGRGADFYWMITFHYRNPMHRGWSKTESSHLLQSGSVNGLTRLRNDYIQVSKDAKHIRNLMLKEIWGIKRLNKKRTDGPVMIFFHEKGAGLQYHTHLLINQTPQPYLSVESLENLWKNRIMPRAKCLSRSNSVDIRAVQSITGAFGYLTKEIGNRDNVIDYEASCLIKTPSKTEVFMREYEAEERREQKAAKTWEALYGFCTHKKGLLRHTLRSRIMNNSKPQTRQHSTLAVDVLRRWKAAHLDPSQRPHGRGKHKITVDQECNLIAAIERG
jgi:hypothetical protein